MILAEKIALLRRQRGWSQEELAGRLNVSRQAVSKWEGGASIPELDKILGMSALFDVSTDYLLKDELEQPEEQKAAFAAPEEPDEEPLRTVTLEEANAYLEVVEQQRGRVAVGVSLCVLSPVPLILMGALAEGTPHESLAGGLGVVALLLVVAAGLMFLIPAGLRLSEYDWLETELFCLGYGAEGIVERARADYAPVFRRQITRGVCLCVVAVLPLLAAAALELSDFWMPVMVDLLLVLVAVAAHGLVLAGMMQDGYDKLLQRGDYTLRNKRITKKVGWFAGVYWCSTTALYLGISFWQNSWRTSWIIWAVAGVLFAALYTAVRAWAGRRVD